jgi:hypothetical protein|nr:hypothetical protein [uncultured Acetatifactor sp.]
MRDLSLHGADDQTHQEVVEVKPCSCYTINQAVMKMAKSNAKADADARLHRNRSESLLNRDVTQKLTAISGQQQKRVTAQKQPPRRFALWHYQHKRHGTPLPIASHGMSVNV